VRADPPRQFVRHPGDEQFWEIKGERKFESVRDKIEDDLLPHLLIDKDRFGQSRRINSQRESCFLTGRAKAAGEIVRQRREIGRLIDCLNPARLSEDQAGLPKGSRSVRARGNAAAQRAAITQNPCAPKRA
jgi:hypothetical protein